MKREEAQKSSEQQPGKPLLQGQMSREDAFRILEALRQTEQQLQPVLRRPIEKQKEREPLKDW